MTRYRFKYVGLPPDQAIKWLDIEPEATIDETKEKVKLAYSLPEGLEINLLSREQLGDTTRTLKSYSLDPTKDVISIVPAQGGGRA